MPRSCPRQRHDAKSESLLAKLQRPGYFEWCRMFYAHPIPHFATALHHPGRQCFMILGIGQVSAKVAKECKPLVVGISSIRVADDEPGLTCEGHAGQWLIVGHL